MLYSMMKLSTFLVVLHISNVFAEVFLPRPTVPNAQLASHVEILAAMPTPAPNAGLVRRCTLRNMKPWKRQTSTNELIGYLGPDETCGYIDGMGGTHPIY